LEEERLKRLEMEEELGSKIKKKKSKKSKKDDL